MIKLSQALINRYEKRVNAGVKWLNKKKPHWLDDIKLDTLNLADAKVCVIGQIFDDFFSKVASPQETKGRYALSFDESASLGFSEGDEGSDKRNYDLLTFVWQQKIKQLKAKA
jgi:hypothetical protein